MNLKDTYDMIAEDWVKDHNNDTWGQVGNDIFLSYLNKDSKILDAGCGGGIKAKEMWNKGYNNIKGSDFSKKMIEIAKNNSPHIPFEVVDLYNLQNHTKKIDGIFMQGVLLHIPKKDILSILSKIKDALNPLGIVYIAVKEIKNGQQENIKMESDYGYKYERFFSYFSMEELEKYFKEIDMEVIWKNNIYAGRANWLQIIARK